MPKPKQQRGRRSKRKLEDEEPGEDVDTETTQVQETKRRKSNNFETEPTDCLPAKSVDFDFAAAYPPVERAFFGVLDEEEQEYFKRADELLAANSFGDAEEKKLFLENVYREADGKELKIAQSQSCSRLLERLIAQSTPQQLKNLLQKFSGNFIHLICHRFASHCCEALFTAAAPVVSDELVAPMPKDASAEQTNSDDVFVSMENLFLHALAELEGNIGYIMTDQYASHALRILLLVFSGEPTSTDTVKRLLRSKRKEDVVDTEMLKDTSASMAKSRSVPNSFNDALEKLLRESVAGLDTPKLRALATHPNANPTLQLLLKLEVAHYGRQRGKDESSIIRTLLPDEPFTPDCESAAFISGLVYDPIGAHLVERIIECAPAKLFKNLYHTFFKERLVSYARNEIATFIDCRILERLSADDLYDAHEAIVPLISTLLEKNWTQLIRTLIERCAVRDIDTQAIAAQINRTWPTADGFDVKIMLKLNPEADTNAAAIDSRHSKLSSGSSAVAGELATTFLSRPSDPAKVRMNILAQAMLIVPGSLSALILDALVNLEPALLLEMAKDPIITRTIQEALTTKNASINQRRKLIQRFYGNINDMALDKAASHVVDCIWQGTHGLAFIRDRIAEELAENEAALRDSACGRAVWRNWKMDMYKRRNADWMRQSRNKASNDGFQSFAELDAPATDVNGAAAAVGPAPVRKKTPLELARERHHAKKEKERMRQQRKDRPAKAPARSSRRGSRSGGAPVAEKSSE